MVNRSPSPRTSATHSRCQLAAFADSRPPRLSGSNQPQAGARRAVIGRSAAIVDGCQAFVERAVSSKKLTYSLQRQLLRSDSVNLQ